MSTRAAGASRTLCSKPRASRHCAPLAAPLSAPLSEFADARRGFASRGFEGFGGFGGFPGGGFGGFQQPPRGDTEKFYKVLGVSKDAGADEIKKAYKKEAMKHHPDRGGDETVFKDISRAYQVLSDPQKKQIYDQHGEAGLEQMEQGGGGGGPGMDPMDLFSQFFGGGFGGRGQPRGKPRTPDSTYELQVGLEELYAGTSREIVFTRDAICSTCNGIGGSRRNTCGQCNGTGTTVHVQQMGPFVQQVQGACRACGGKGHVVPPSERCKPCHGRGVAKEKKSFSVEVDKGMEDGHQFRFRGQADEAPDHDTGDVVIILREKRHKSFARMPGAALVMQKKITLSEALCGFELNLPFLDGKPLTVRSRPGEVFRPGDVVVVAGKGMPLQKGPQGERFGNLHIKLDVEFPKSMPQESQEKLMEVLGSRHMSEEAPGDCTAKRLQPQQAEQLHRLWQEEELRKRQAQQSQGQQEGCTQM